MHISSAKCKSSVEMAYHIKFFFLVLRFLVFAVERADGQCKTAAIRSVLRNKITSLEIQQQKVK